MNGAIYCDICGRETPSTDTTKCNRCWELNARMRRDPQLARKIQLAMDQERNPEPPLGISSKEWSERGGKD